MSRALRILGAPWRILGPVHALFLALALIVWLGGCAGNPTASGSLKAAYDGVATYQRLVGQTVDRGRISADSAERLIAEGERVRVQVDHARDALALCGGKVPCDSFEAIMRRLQPMLADLERRLREEEAAKARQGAKP